MKLPPLLEVQPRLPVASIAASCRFYRDTLGFEHGLEEPSNDDGFAIVRRNSIGLQLVPKDGQSVAPITLWIQVADALEEYERVKALTPIEWGPEVYWYGCREFAVLDPDGHRIIFSSPSDEEPTCKE